jgi:spermidine synthase
VFDYTRNSVAAMGDAASGSVLCLGGGAYSIPQHIVRELGGQATVVEIDAGVTEAARKWFGLAQTEGIAGHRITTENMDGRVYLADCGRRFDAVFNDTFAGNTPARGLCTLEAVRLVKSCLAEGGLFVTNAIGVAQRDGESLLADEVATMREVFARVHVLWHEQPEDMGKRQNYIIVATDDMSWEVPDGLVEIEVSSGKTRILTDDDSPIEMLSASERNAD